MLTPEQDKMLREIHAAIAKPHGASRPTVGDAVRGVAFDANDPVVKVVPKAWRGEEMRGRRYSECPAAFLGMLAVMLDQFADKNEADPERQKYAKWDRANAVTARKWRASLEGKPELPLGDAELEAAF